MQNNRLHILVIIVTAFLLYARVIHFEFIGLDDTLLITDNQAFLQDLSNIPKAFENNIFHVPGFTMPNMYYRPLLTLSFMLDAQVGGADPKSYYFTNVILHILACLLLLSFLKRLQLKPEAAFFLTLIFCVHPLLSQAVSWVPGRNDSLLTIFFLSSMILFLLYLETSKMLHLLLHWFFFVLALFTKESALLLPFFSLYYWIFMVKDQPIPKSRLHIISGYLVIIAGWLLLKNAAISGQRDNFITMAMISSNLPKNLPFILQYLSKLFFPYNLSTFSSPRDTNYVLGTAAILFIVCGIVLSRNKNWSRIVFGSLWFLMFLLPTFIAFEVTGSGHRVYLPLVGLLIVFSEFDFIKRLHFHRQTSIMTLLVVSLLVAVNVKHTASFENQFKFWKTAVEDSPNYSLAYLNYGAALEKERDYEEAARIYEQGIRLNPTEPMIHNNLGVVYAEMMMIEKAEKEFNREIEVNPAYSEAYYNLGFLYEITENIPQAIQMWKKTLTVNPNHQKSKRALAKYNQ